MITIKAYVCATQVIRDADHGAISAINILEGIQVGSFPFVMQFCSAVVILERDVAQDAARHDANVIIRLGDQELGRGHLAVDFEDKRVTRQIMVMNTLAIPAPGDLAVEFSIPQINLSATYTINVAQIPRPVVAAPAPANDAGAPAAELDRPAPAAAPDGRRQGG